jgi:hypothetical protein
MSTNSRLIAVADADIVENGSKATPASLRTFDHTTKRADMSDEPAGGGA